MKIRLTKQGRELMQQAVDTIRANPERFDMRQWISPLLHLSDACIVKAFQEFKESPVCGTTLCFAGEIYLAAGCPPSEDGFESTVARLIAYEDDVDHLNFDLENFPLFFAYDWHSVAEIPEGTARCYQSGNNEPFLRGVETIIRQGYMTVR